MLGCSRCSIKEIQSLLPNKPVCIQTAQDGGVRLFNRVWNALAGAWNSVKAFFSSCSCKGFWKDRNVVQIPAPKAAMVAPTNTVENVAPAVAPTVALTTNAVENIVENVAAPAPAPITNAVENVAVPTVDPAPAPITNAVENVAVPTVAPTIATTTNAVDDAAGTPVVKKDDKQEATDLDPVAQKRKEVGEMVGEVEERVGDIQAMLKNITIKTALESMPALKQHYDQVQKGIQCINTQKNPNSFDYIVGVQQAKTGAGKIRAMLKKSVSDKQNVFIKTVWDQVDCQLKDLSIELKATRKR